MTQVGGWWVGGGLGPSTGGQSVIRFGGPPVGKVHGNFAQTQGRLRARDGLFAGGRCVISFCPVGAQSANHN